MLHFRWLLHVWWWWWWLICIIVEDDSKEQQTICKLQPIIYCLCWCGCWDQSSSDLEEIKQLSFSYSQSASPGQALSPLPGPGCLKGWRLKSPLSPVMRLVAGSWWGWGWGWGWGKTVCWQFLLIIKPTDDDKGFFRFPRSAWLGWHFLFLFFDRLEHTVTLWHLELSNCSW